MSWMRLSPRWCVAPLPSVLGLECDLRQLVISYSRWILSGQLVLRHLLRQRGVLSSPLWGQLLGVALLLGGVLEVHYRDPGGHQVTGQESVDLCDQKVWIGISLLKFRQVHLVVTTVSPLQW